MDAATFQKIHPKEFYRKFLEHSLRPDGRGFDDIRDTVVATGSVSSADGSALVKLGNTTVVCGIKAEVGKPEAVNPNRGRLDVSLTLDPLCSPSFSIGKASEQCVSLGEFLTNVVVSTEMFNLDSLCIQEDASVWVLYADVVCLDYDGNVVDAALLALTTALKNLELPETHVGDDGTVFIVARDDESPAPVKLSVKHTPASCSFGVLDGKLLADPTASEEALLDGGGGALTTVVYNDQGQLCGVYKPGGGELSDTGLEHCMAMAKARAAVCTRLASEAAKAEGGQGTGMSD